jgi:hypothetical protein
MSFWPLVITAGICLAVLILISHLIIGRHSQRRFWKSFTVSHFLFVLVLSAIYFPGEKDAQHQLFWLIPTVLDLPFSFLFPVLAMGNMIVLALAFVTLGTLQYTVIGWAIDLALTKQKKQLFPNKKILVSIFALVVTWSVIGYRNYSYINLPESAKAEIELNNADSEIHRFYALNDAAKTSFNAKEYEKAKRYATELSMLAEKYPNDWNYGNAVYDAHVVLGRLALLQNDIETAKEELFLAVKTPGSPQLDSFGPNMTLARDLLEVGQTEPVIHFLKECKRFWYDHQKVDEWVKVIESGGMPEFKANLLY